MLKRRQIMTREQEPGIKNSWSWNIKTFLLHHVKAPGKCKQMSPTELCLRGPRQGRATPPRLGTELQCGPCRSRDVRLPGGQEFRGIFNCSVSLNELCQVTTPLRELGVGNVEPGREAPALPACCAVKMWGKGECLVVGGHVCVCVCVIPTPLVNLGLPLLIKAPGPVCSLLCCLTRGAGM